MVDDGARQRFFIALLDGLPLDEARKAAGWSRDTLAGLRRNERFEKAIGEARRAWWEGTVAAEGEIRAEALGVLAGLLTARDVEIKLKAASALAASIPQADEPRGGRP